MDIPTLEDQVRRGQAVARLLKDEHISDAFEQVEQRFVEEWKDSGTLEQREEAWAKVQGLQAVIACLHGIVTDGEHALHLLGDSR